MALIPGFGAIILCGGQSRRMGHSKALLKFGDKTLIENAIDILGQIASEIVIVASPGQVLPQLPSCIKRSYDHVAYQGPLTGMQSGFNEISSDIDSVFISATDSPLLQSNLVRHLASQLNDFDLVMPFDGSYYHPLTSVYRVQPVLEKINQLIGNNRHRPLFLKDELYSETIHTRDLIQFDPNLDSFRNINTPAEYRNILRIANLPIPLEFRACSVTIEFYGIPRLLTKVGSAKLEADSLDELVLELIRTFPELNGSVIVNQTLHPAYRFMRGTNEFLTDNQTTLSSNDKILLLAVDAGG
jgi:molybdopterin-guanine dinucleotide biosynthesis protein A